MGEKVVEMKRVFGFVCFALMMLPLIASAQSTRWIYGTTRDEFTDQIMHAAMTNGWGGAKAAVACKEGEVFIFVTTGFLDVQFGETREGRFRIDKKPAVDRVWRASAKGGMLLTEKYAIELAKEIRDATSRFLVKNEVGTARFSVKNSTVTISKVLAACGAK